MAQFGTRPENAGTYWDNLRIMLKKIRSLTDDQIEKFAKMYENPELFVRVNGKIFCLPLTMEEAEKWRREYES